MPRQRPASPCHRHRALGAALLLLTVTAAAAALPPPVRGVKWGFPRSLPSGAVAGGGYIYYGGCSSYGWWNGGYYAPAPYLGVDVQAVAELARIVDPALLDPGYGAPEPEPPQPEEIALDRLAAGDWEGAVATYAELAERRRKDEIERGVPAEAVDRRLERLHGFALACEGRLDEAAAVLTEAYDADPSLRRRPLLGERLVGAAALRRAVDRAVARANRVQTHDAWYVVAVLMHAQGRHTVANEMMERATAIDTGNAPAP